jgi:mannosyltransferase
VGPRPGVAADGPRSALTLRVTVSTQSPPRPAPAPLPAERPAPAPVRGGAALRVLVGLALLAAVALRLVSTSDLWLDEAQSVAIATMGLPEMVDGLRSDGAPPLYYVLLWAWTSLFGTGDVAVRSLSGLASIAALPVVWALGRRLGGPALGLAALLLLASNPFAIRYATEARMYSLIVLLTAVGGLVLLRVWERPGRLPQVGLAVVTGLLLLTHYWSIFLAAAVWLGLAWRVRRGAEESRPAALRALIGVSGGAVVFAPWLPNFWFQVRNTGAPWAAAPHPGDLFGVVGQWAMAGSYLGGVLLLVLLALAALGIAGRPGAGRTVLVDLRGVEPGRTLAAITVGTLGIAFVASTTGGAFAGRYTAVVLVPAVLVLALGLRPLPSARIRTAVLVLAVALGLVGGVEAPLEQRTQGGAVAAAIAEGASPGDVVAFCPDQLGPSVERALGPDSGLVQVVFPTLGPPAPVDWVDYEARNRAGSGAEFAGRVDELAGDGDVWLVWMTGYRTFGRECTDLALALGSLRPGGEVELEIDRRRFEPMQLDRYPAG